MISETLAGLLMDHYTTSEFILVYRYSHWDPNTGEVVLSSEMYTLEAIRNGLGIPATETGQKVLRSEIDSKGRYNAGQPDPEAGGYLGKFFKRRRS